MPNLTITRRELESGDLPRLCMKCGKRTKKPMAKTLVFWPPRVRAIAMACSFVGNLILGPIAYLALRSRIVRFSSKLPICARRRSMWKEPIYVMFGPTVVGFLSVVAVTPLIEKGSADTFLIVLMIWLAATIGGFGVGISMLSNAVEELEAEDTDVVEEEILPPPLPQKRPRIAAPAPAPTDGKPRPKPRA